MTYGIVDGIVRYARKHMPEILIGIGVSGIVTGTVVACKETKKLDPILEEHKAQMDDIHESFEKGETPDEETGALVPYDVKDRRRDTATVYFRTGTKIAKLYWPSVLIIGGSIGCILGSHGIMTRRNTGLAAAYAGLSESFKNYRKNIVDKFGEVADMEARHNVKAKKIKCKNGEEDSVQYKVTEQTEESDHSRFFDTESIFWDKNVNMNLVKLLQAQTALNRKLKTRRSHTVTLNEVYDALDLRPSEDGQVLGYTYVPGRDKDRLDEFGIPQIINFSIIHLYENGEKTNKTVNEAISAESITEPVMLIDFPDLEVIV